MCLLKCIVQVQKCCSSWKSFVCSPFVLKVNLLWLFLMKLLHVHQITQNLGCDSAKHGLQGSSSLTSYKLLILALDMFVVCLFVFKVYVSVSSFLSSLFRRYWWTTADGDAIATDKCFQLSLQKGFYYLEKKIACFGNFVDSAVVTTGGNKIVPC